MKHFFYQCLQKWQKKWRYKQALTKLKASNYGRDHGWDIEFRGLVIGELVNPQFAGMFCDSYQLNCLDFSKEHVLSNPYFWQNCEFRFKNKIYKVYADNAYPPIHPCETPTVRYFVKMRGLYFSKPPCCT